MARLHIDEEIARRKAMKDARDVLTAEQREKVRPLMPHPAMPAHAPQPRRPY